MFLWPGPKPHAILDATKSSVLTGWLSSARIECVSVSHAQGRSQDKVYLWEEGVTVSLARSSLLFGVVPPCHLATWSQLNMH